MNRKEIAQTGKKLYSTENMCNEYMNEYDCGGRKERVLIIDVNCKKSSTGKIVYDLYKALVRDGRNAAVCYGRGEDIKEEHIYKFGLDWETGIHALLARITGYNGCFSPISTRRLIKYIEKFNPDLIHINELHAYFVNVKVLVNYIKRKNIPVVWTFHCEYMYTGKCGHAFECSKFEENCGNCPALREYPKSLFFDRTSQMLATKKKLFNNWEPTIVTPSRWLMDRVKLSFLKNKKIKVIYNGVDTSIFKPQDISNLRYELKIPEKCKVALFVTPNIADEKKGGTWLFKIAEDLKEKNIIFLIVGGGDKTSYTVPSNVKFIGAIYDQNLLAQYYSLADIFLLCSKRETYSMTCAEALCCGTPVVGFKSGAPETVFTEPYAKFVEYGDVEDMIGAIDEKIKL